MNSENSKNYKPLVLKLNFTDKTDLRRGEKILLYQILVFNTHGKTIIINHTIIINLKYLLQHGMMNLNYLKDHI